MAAAFGEQVKGESKSMAEPKTGSDAVLYQKKVKRSRIRANGQLGLWLQFPNKIARNANLVVQGVTV
jgi:hypothetical protein